MRPHEMKQEGFFTKCRHCAALPGTLSELQDCPGPASDGRAEMVERVVRDALDVLRPSEAERAATALSGRAILARIDAETRADEDRKAASPFRKLPPFVREALTTPAQERIRAWLGGIGGAQIDLLYRKLYAESEPDYDAILLAARKRREDDNDEPIGGWNPKAAYMEAWNSNREFHNSHSLHRALSLDPTDTPAIRRAMMGGGHG